MTDRIAVTGIRAYGYHGVYEQEKRSGQEFTVDVVLWLDLARAAATDDLGDTVDYGRLAEQAVTVVSGPSCDLIETLATRIVEQLMIDQRLHAAEVTVHKPNAPLSVPVADIAVTIRRSRRAGRLGSGGTL